MTTKGISLSAELAEVRCAIEGARFLADALAARGFDNLQRELQAPVAITAVLVLAELRLHQIERVLRGDEDPLLLWAPHNDVTSGSGEGDAQDVVLRPWNQADENEAPPARKKPGRGGPRKRRGQALPPESEQPVQSTGGGEPPPSTGSTS